MANALDQVRSRAVNRVNGGIETGPEAPQSTASPLEATALGNLLFFFGLVKTIWNKSVPD